VTRVPVRLKNGRKAWIREARAEDAERMVELNTHVLSETSFHIREPDEYPARVDMEARFVKSVGERSDAVYLVVEYEGDLIGMLLFQAERLRRARHVGSFGMAVLTEHQRQGVGTRLLEGLLDWCREQPRLEKVKLEVFSENQVAIKLYERHGFVREGVRRREIRVDGQHVDVIMMARFL
jgi:RimJ/RimL family protein N-acetyltransferase